MISFCYVSIILEHWAWSWQCTNCLVRIRHMIKNVHCLYMFLVEWWLHLSQLSSHGNLGILTYLVFWTDILTLGSFQLQEKGTPNRCHLGCKNLTLNPGHMLAFSGSNPKGFISPFRDRRERNLGIFNMVHKIYSNVRLCSPWSCMIHWL